MDVPSRGVFHALNRRIDHAIGADRLNTGTRKRLRAEQIRAIAQMTPVIATGAVLISLLMLITTWDMPGFQAIVAWSAALYITLIVSMRRWFSNRPDVRPKRTASREMRAVVLDSFFMGVIWGVLPIVILPSSGPHLITILCIVIAGVLSATSFALLILPQAALAFALPLLIGLFIGEIGLDSTAERFTLSVLLFVNALIMAFICLRHARNRVDHLAGEQKIREQKDIIGLLLKEFEDNSSDWLWEFDRQGRIQRVSDRFANAAGLAKDRLTNRDFREFLRSIGHDSGALAELDQRIHERESFCDIQLRVIVGGIERFWRVTGKPTRNEAGVFTGYIGTASDITAEKNSERRISYLAHNDVLTGLLNRAKFTEHLKQCAARLERYGSPFCVLYLDLDQFKAVNDSRGHLAGDRLLAQVSRRIRAELRETDLAARLGGDEFAILLNGDCDAEGVGQLARRLVESISEPYQFGEDTLIIGTSIGIAIAPADGTRPEQVLRNADLALYRAKAEGRGTFRFFERQMDSDLRERRLLELELARALGEGEFVLHYQPLVSATDNTPSGFEALLRWNHPLRGSVPPSEFIPIAEQTGLIRQIGDWTIQEACRAAARWPGEAGVAVNLSAKHFQTSDIAAVVREALAASRLPPGRLEIEITEGLLIDNADDVLAKLAEIKALGVTIALDDFGTGYSSLSSLLKFPFDKIKIDRSLVSASSTDMVSRDVLRSIAALGRALKVGITAEGVETQEQVDFLRDIDCAELQGFYFARPLGEFDLARYFLAQFNPVPGNFEMPPALEGLPAQLRIAN